MEKILSKLFDILEKIVKKLKNLGKIKYLVNFEKIFSDTL